MVRGTRDRGGDFNRQSGISGAAIPKVGCQLHVYAN